jgi:hypothetical protein
MSLDFFSYGLSGMECGGWSTEACDVRGSSSMFHINRYGSYIN